MADNANKDSNFVNTLLGTSSTDGKSPVNVYADPTTHRLLVDVGGGGGGLTPTSGQYKIYVTVGTANADYLVSNYIDFGDAVNAAYAGLPSSGGTIFFLNGTYSFLTPIVAGTNGKPVNFIGGGSASTFLKFTPTSGNAITINDGNPTGHLVHQITGFTLMGKTSLVAAGQANTNTSIGIFYGGANGAVGVNTHDMNVNGFGSNWEIGSNAYMLAFNNNANSGGNGGQASRGSLLHIDTASNSGERNIFDGNSFTDPGNSLATNAIYITNAGTASNAFTHNSFDDAQIFVGASNGMTSINENHFENSAFGTYQQYILVLGVSSDLSTQISFCFNEIANDGNGSGNTIQTVIKHGGQLVAIGNHINNYGGATITNFVDHSLDNGLESEVVGMTQIQGGGLTNLIAGSGGVAWSQAVGACFTQNIANSYSIGLRANGNNTNQFFSGSNTTGTFDHSGNWAIGVDTSSLATMTGSLNVLAGVTTLQNFNTILDASTFSGSDIGAKINAAYAYITTLGFKACIITVPAGVFSYSTPIVFGTNGVRVSLRGAPGGGTELDFTGAAGTIALTINTGIQAVNIDHTKYEAVRDITFKGNLHSTTNPQVGIFAGGANGAAGAILRCCNIEGFGRGLSLGANTYMFEWADSVVRNCGQNFYAAPASNSGEGILFTNVFCVDPYNGAFVATDGFYLDNSAVSSMTIIGGSFDDCNVHILQANNVTFVGTHFENPDYTDYGAYTYVTVDQNPLTNVVMNGCVFFNDATNASSGSPTNFISNGGTLTMDGTIVRHFQDKQVTNFATITGSGVITWHGFNNCIDSAVGAVANIVSGIPAISDGWTDSSGLFSTVSQAGVMKLGVPYVAKTSTYGIANTDEIINCTSGTFTVTLPTAVGLTGKKFVIKNTGTGTITIATTSAQTIDGQSSGAITLATQYAAITVVSNGANWIITA